MSLPTTVKFCYMACNVYYDVLDKTFAAIHYLCQQSDLELKIDALVWTCSTHPQLLKQITTIFNCHASQWGLSEPVIAPQTLPYKLIVPNSNLLMRSFTSAIKLPFADFPRISHWNLNAALAAQLMFAVRDFISYMWSDNSLSTSHFTYLLPHIIYRAVEIKETFQ